MGNKNSSVSIRFVVKISDIGNLSQNINLMLNHQKWQYGLEGLKGPDLPREAFELNRIYLLQIFILHRICYKPSFARVTWL